MGAEPLDVYLVSRGEQAQNWCHNALDKLRAIGVSATMDLGGRSMKAQMKEANRENARYTLIVGESELESGKFTWRDMKNSTEESLDWSHILNKLRSE
jgi:histidyl-tRNA synthetase